MEMFLTFFFDDELELALEEIQKNIRKDIQSDYIQNSHRPHITLACYDMEDAAKLDSVLSKCCENIEEFPIEFRGLGLFPNVSCLYAAPVVDFRILSIHKNLISAIEQETLFPHHLAVGNWIPHCELAVRIPADQFPLIYNKLETNWNSLSGFVKGIGLLVYPENVDRKRFSFNLDNRSKN